MPLTLIEDQPVTRAVGGTGRYYRSVTSGRTVEVQLSLWWPGATRRLSAGATQSPSRVGLGRAGENGRCLPLARQWRHSLHVMAGHELRLRLNSRQFGASAGPVGPVEKLLLI